MISMSCVVRQMESITPECDFGRSMLYFVSKTYTRSSDLNLVDIKYLSLVNFLMQIFTIIPNDGQKSKEVTGYMLSVK